MNEAFRTLFGAALVGSLAMASPARADEPTERERAAEKLFVEGRDAESRGEHELACAKFRSSVALVPVPNAVANVARCAEREGRAVEALRAWELVIGLLPPGDARIAPAKERAAALAAKVPRITLVLPSDLPERARISIDGSPMSRDAWGVSIPLAPGEHAIVVEAPGREERRFSVTLSDGDRREVAVSVAPPPVTPPPPPPQAPSKPDGRWAAGFAAGGVGVAGVVTAAVTGAILLARDARIDDLCPNRVCSSEGIRQIEGSKPLLVANGIAWGAGIAGIGAGVILLVTARSASPPRAAVAPMVIPGGAGVLLGGSF